jgi:hypothetical protein
MASYKIRTIVERPLYVACKESLGIDCKRLDEILDGITLKIAVEPTFFPRLPSTDVRRARTQEFPPDIPSYSIWYTYDSQKVVLELIELTPADELPYPDSDPD